MANVAHCYRLFKAFLAKAALISSINYRCNQKINNLFTCKIPGGEAVGGGSITLELCCHDVFAAGNCVLVG